MIIDKNNFSGTDSESEISFRINQNGDLYLGNKSSGYNLPDTPENRERILRDFQFYTGIPVKQR